VATPGAPRSAAWVGDTLLIATGTSIERFILAAQLPVAGGLGVSLDPASAMPRAVLSWTATPSTGQVGWSVYRDLGPATSGTSTPGGIRLNGYLLPTTAQGAVDTGLVSGQEHRYRLEAVYADGRLQTVAEGSVYVPSNPRVGRPYPNPFRAAGGGVNVPYRAFAGGGAVTLRVVDVRGRLVREINSPPPGPGGFGEVHWDGKDRDGRRVPTGVYYLYVRGPGLKDARPVVHVR
jgi:hypothetical protein